jgi:hypothetical protein
MPEPETHAEARTPWYRKVALVILVPFVLPTIPLVLVLLLAFGAYAGLHNFVSQLRFRARMRQRGRFLRWRDLRDRIADEGPGTLIIESPSLGWGFTHAWWTPERVLDVSPHAPPTEEDYRNAVNLECFAWDRWQWENYTHPDRGRAWLLRVWNGRSLERSVRSAFPSVAVVRTWTALAHLPQSAAEWGGA